MRGCDSHYYPSLNHIKYITAEVVASRTGYNDIIIILIIMLSYIIAIMACQRNNTISASHLAATFLLGIFAQRFTMVVE